MVVYLEDKAVLEDDVVVLAWCVELKPTTESELVKLRKNEHAIISNKHINACHYRPASETPFKWRFAGGPFVAHD